LRHPLCLPETDTFVTADGHQNPASYGTFPRLLRTYVDAGLFSFEEAVHRMTGAAAERLAWKDRGWIRRGCAADLVVLDRATLRDTATFPEPARFPEGIEQVWINGRRVVDGGRYDAGARAGRVLRA
jgi:N-acyl-D-amino-acid deacylase